MAMFVGKGLGQLRGMPADHSRQFIEYMINLERALRETEAGQNKAADVWMNYGAAKAELRYYGDNRHEARLREIEARVFRFR